MDDSSICGSCGKFSRLNLHEFPSFGEISAFETLDLSQNPIISLRTFSVLPLLEEINLSQTEIRTFAYAQRQPSLEKLRIKGSPVANYSTARIMALVALGDWIQEIDDKEVTEKELKIAKEIAPKLRPLLVSGWILDKISPPHVINPRTNANGSLDDIFNSPENSKIDYLKDVNEFDDLTTTKSLKKEQQQNYDDNEDEIVQTKSKHKSRVSKKGRKKKGSKAPKKDDLIENEGLKKEENNFNEYSVIKDIDVDVSITKKVKRKYRRNKNSLEVTLTSVGTDIIRDDLSLMSSFDYFTLSLSPLHSVQCVLRSGIELMKFPKYTYEIDGVDQGVREETKERVNILSIGGSSANASSFSSAREEESYEEEEEAASINSAEKSIGNQQEQLKIIENPLINDIANKEKMISYSSHKDESSEEYTDENSTSELDDFSSSTSQQNLETEEEKLCRAGQNYITVIKKFDDDENEEEEEEERETMNTPVKNVADDDEEEDDDSYKEVLNTPVIKIPVEESTDDHILSSSSEAQEQENELTKVKAPPPLAVPDPMIEILTNAVQNMAPNVSDDKEAKSSSTDHHHHHHHHHHHKKERKNSKKGKSSNKSSTVREPIIKEGASQSDYFKNDKKSVKEEKKDFIPAPILETSSDNNIPEPKKNEPILTPISKHMLNRRRPTRRSSHGLQEPKTIDDDSDSFIIDTFSSQKT